MEATPICIYVSIHPSIHPSILTNPFIHSNRKQTACCAGNEWPRGVGLLRRMENFGHSPNEETYAIILQAFAKVSIVVESALRQR